MHAEEQNQAVRATAAALDAAAEPLAGLWNAGPGTVRPAVSPQQLRVMLAVEDEEPMTLGRLAEQIDVIASSASRICDRLQAAGLLSRSVSAADRREVLLRLTTDGRSVLDRLRQRRRRDLAEVLSRMSPEARGLLLEGLRSFAHATRKGRASSVRTA
ncbi:MAG TPA: MarR family transcriptional regulator [Pseudonocardiaceae bacterium]|jgi:DNA-binding MarR family transcriptional regulator|nr:MarR family transcriptional regulator [Pseudonocardiaceae bacterium]